MPPHLLPQPCYLIGLPGAGKTFIGEKLSKKTSVPFFDTDQWIESQSDLTISEIFTKEGEGAFRKLEVLAIELLKNQTAIVACGGGLPIIPGMIQRLLQTGYVVWLDTDLKLIERRLFQNLTHRPLLKPHENNLPIYLEALLHTRRPFYVKAHHREVILNDRADFIFDNIINLYRNHCLTL